MLKRKKQTILFAMVFTCLYAATAWADLTKTEVSQLYVSLFGRASEGEGNAYWCSTQKDITEAANTMLNTDAAKNYFGASLDLNQAFIAHIYLNTLSKTIADDPEGIAYWVGLLDAGLTRGEVAASLVGVIKNYAPDGPYYNPGDAKTIAAYNQFTNRVEVSNYMADTVQTAPADWATSTSFTGTLIVTDDASTLRDAEHAIGIIAGISSDLTDDIEYYMAMVSSVGNMSPMIDEIGTVLTEAMSGDSSIVTITTSLDDLDINDLPSSISISVNLDTEDTGYTPKGSSSVFTGQLVINVTDISLDKAAIIANAALTATNVKRDGELILNGGMTLAINAEMSESNIALSANVDFFNLQSLDSQVNGGVSVNIPSITTDGELSQPISITFNQLTTQEYQITGTATLTQNVNDSYDALFNLKTNQGTIAGTVRLAMDGDTTVISTPMGSLTAGDYNLNINNVTMDPAICSETPASGNIVVTRSSEINTISFSNCTHTVN